MTRLSFRRNCGSQLRLLLCRQIAGLVFPVQREQPNLVIVAEEVVDEAKTTSLALPAALVTPPQLPEPAGPRHDVAGLRLLREEQLKRHEVRIVQIRVQVPRKGRRFKELHCLQLYAKCVGFTRSADDDRE